MAAERRFIGEQMNREIVAVSFESFIEYYAPFQPSSERLRTDGLVVPTTAGVDRFAGFQEPPSRQYTSRKVAYGHLSAICRSILRSPWTTEWSVVPWFKNPTSRPMNNGPRWTPIYSVTIEDEAMCFWYWSRSHSAKSEAVDITKDVRATIRGLVCFLFASMPELGYDKTVQRRFDPALGGYCFIFLVRDSYFKVLRSIAEHLGPCTIAGPSTRVFEVIKVPSFDNITATTESAASPMVLKDVLQDGQDPPQLIGLNDAEKELLRNALRDDNYREYFLAIDCDMQGVQSKSLAPKTWCNDVFSFWDSSSDRIRPLYAVPPPADSARSSSPRANSRSFVAKRQYRVVFKEVCQALHRVGDSGTVFKALKDCLLDYAKEFDAKGTRSSDPKIGTPAFMATEILSQELILFSNSSVSSKDKEAARGEPIIHNFQHDLESFWLLLWILTTRLPTCTPGFDLKIYTDQLFLVRGLFYIWPDRLNPYRNMTIGLDVRRYLPDDMKVFADCIQSLNKALYDASINRLLDFGNTASYAPLYG
ncbi:hypothetical protein BD311DRAFT_777439 [Dichomitus squalens]|uniref:Fungal-type protein kinase domain-containing protein n=1 Tax=Dichomitus squalens TaxID=114155 RepID=A0A4Q9MPS9_9APHY|nr:hypothetical protein BD311DRAFT_777439 [Dichomitus squalens]